MAQQKIKRELSRVNLLFISFAAIFGSGWLFAPFYAAQMAGPASLLAWGLGALMSAVIGVTMAEVITLFPNTGGLNSVALITHGELLAFFVTVFNILVFIILPAIEVRAILQYLSSHFKDLMLADGGVSPVGYLLAFVLLTFITLANLYGARITALLTSASVLFKVVTPFLICSTFLYVIGTAETHGPSLWEGSFPIPWSQVFQAIATSGIIFSFNGFNQATVFAGEAKNPQKTIPFAILGSLAFSGALYILVQYVFLISVPKESLTQGWSHLSFPGDQGPFAGIAVLLGLNWLLLVIYADAVISPMGTAFTYASAAPRMFYALSTTNGIFSGLQKLNRHGVPFLAIFITFVLELVVFLLLPSLKAMISILVAAFVLCYTVAPASLLRLRKTRPEMERAFRVPFTPLFSFLSLFFSNLMVFSCGWGAVRNLVFAALLLIVAYAVLVPRNALKIYRQLRGCEWFIVQLFGIAALCYWDQLDKPPFLYPVLGLATLSGVVLWMSQRWPRQEE